MAAPLHRREFLDRQLHVGASRPIDLSQYATTGLRTVAIAPSGMGKTNTGLVIAEQLVDYGWVAVLIDPERELEALYGKAVADADELRERLQRRDRSFIVVSAKDATEFIPYGRAILEAADTSRKPIYVMLDEGQVFSAGRRRRDDIGEATDIINEFAERGRKRALDLFMTAFRFTGTIHRTLFANTNLLFVGSQQDPAAWAALAPRFRTSRIDFSDLAALGPAEFFCFTRADVEKVRVPMAKALEQVAPKAVAVRPALPATFTQWDRAVAAMPLPQLQALTAPVVNLLGAVAGLSPQQMLAGQRALQDELELRGAL